MTKNSSSDHFTRRNPRLGNDSCRFWNRILKSAELPGEEVHDFGSDLSKSTFPHGKGFSVPVAVPPGMRTRIQFRMGFWRLLQPRDKVLIYLAPQVGLEPTTLRLTAECSAIELLRSVWRHYQNYQTGRVASKAPAPHASVPLAVG